MYEFFKINSSQSSPFIISGLLLGVLAYVLHCFYILGYIPGAMLLFLTLIPVVLFAQSIFSKDRRPFYNVGITLAGLGYCVLPFICLSYLPINPIEIKNAKDYSQVFRWEIPMMYFLIIMANDSFAYLVGRFLGKTKLARNISPGKTVEGLLGGIAGSLLFLFLLKDNLLKIDAYIRSSPWSKQKFGDTRVIFTDLDWYAFFALTVFFALLGDLSESRLKRSFHIKHSSNFFPGHGGFLDRYDSILLSSIPCFIYLYIMKY